MKNIIRICAIIVIVCFFCPFFFVSCQGMEEDISGFNLAQGTDYSASNMMLMAVVVIAAVIILVSLMQALEPLSKIVNIGGPIAGLITMAYIYNNVMRVAQEQQASKYIEVRYGFWGCVLGYAAILCFTLYGQYTGNRSINDRNRNLYED